MEPFFFVIALVVAISLWKAFMGVSYANLMRSGIPARGILLSVANQKYGSVGTGLQQLQKRAVFIDIEIPGEAPYEQQAVVLVPLNLVRDVLPGATVELRLSRNRKTILVAGPGVGFNSSALQTQGQINQGAA